MAFVELANKDHEVQLKAQEKQGFPIIFIYFYNIFN